LEKVEEGICRNKPILVQKECTSLFRISLIFLREGGVENYGYMKRDLRHWAVPRASRETRTGCL
jgi:hypothetical protein